MAATSYATSSEAGTPDLGRSAFLRVRCPACLRPSVRLQELTAEGMVCPGCGYALRKTENILRALLPGRQKYYERSRKEYLKIRRAEGRGSENPSYYLELPYKDLTGRRCDEWAIRAKTYRHFETHVLPAQTRDILDLGAGNGWTSHRLFRRGHRPVAVDILTDSMDGLGASRHYGGFPLVEAEFDRLPFVDGQFDLAIFNSALHYSTDYHRTLLEARRCLRPTGCIVILDSPIYKQRKHGEQMQRERHERFEALYGFRSDSIPSLEYLYDSLLEQLSRDLGLSWQIHRPWYGWRWHLRPWKARLGGQRPPSRFWILVGSFSQP